MMSASRWLFLLAAATAWYATTTSAQQEVLIGSFTTRNHDVAGQVVALSERVLEVRNFVFDGNAPAAYFWADASSTPTRNGRILEDANPSNRCGTEPLPGATGIETFRVEFPEGTSILNYLGGSISVWCEAFYANFGEVVVPSSLPGLLSTAEGPALQCSESPPPATTANGVSIGEFTTRNHDVAGEIVVLSDRVLEIRNFVFDGNAPAAFFWADTNSNPTSRGIVLQDASPTNTCGATKLPGADGDETFRVEFPEGTSIRNYLGGSISVWCEAFNANFGEAIIPLTLPDGIASTEDGPALECSGDAPSEPQEPTGGGAIFLGDFNTRNHDVAGQMFALSERVLEVRNFEFDGNAPAAYFWADTNSRPSDNGLILQDGSPSRNCGNEELPDANGDETYRVEFPEGTSLLDYLGGSISVWCEEFSANFGEVVLPDSLPGLLATEDGPALECSASPVPDIAVTPEGFNCEPLNDEYQVRWQVQGNEIAIELVGLIDDEVYMGFGISGSNTQTRMVGADAMIADVVNGTFRARDFYMSEQGQCSSNGDGVCPDPESSFTDDLSTVSGLQDSGVTLVRFKRPLTSTDINEVVNGQSVDRTIAVEPGVSTFVVWALGPVQPETGLPFFHSIDYPREDVSLEFGRAPVVDNCPPLVGGRPAAGTEAPALPPFFRPPIVDTTELVAHIGLSGGERGVQGITNRTAWGIAWYINDLLIPVVEMRRGTTYTFRVNGGDDPTQNSRYHPLYLTTSSLGGYDQRTQEERLEETVIAGLDVVDNTDAGFEILVAGPLCLYDATEDTTEAAMFGTYDQFFTSQDTSCADDSTLASEAAVLEFTPDESTPDLIYYQCVTHTSLGFEIRVIDQDAPSIVDVDCSNPTTVELGDVTISAVVDPVAATLTAEVTYNGIGWIAMGFTNGASVMVGSEAVIGLPDEPNGPMNPGKYNLNARQVSGVVLMPEAQQTLINATIEQTDSQTIMRFTKLLVEPGEHPISASAENTFLFAYGSDNDLDVHQARGGFSVLLNQCAVSIEGELLNAQFVNGGNFEIESDDMNRSIWVAHGACAATAWAILVPLAIGSSIIRKSLEAIGLPKGTWFMLHRGLNMLAAVLTIAAFSLAVHGINQQPNSEHFSISTHHTLGLVIFILTLLQALGGILRPHLSEPVEINELDEEDSQLKTSKLVPGEKSPQRRLFEVMHRVLGVSLLGMAWWQVQDGFGLFSTIFSEENISNIFWGVVGGICGLFVIVFVYEKAVLSKRSAKE